MRIASAFINPESANAYYRMIAPLQELMRRGHSVLWPGEHDPKAKNYDLLYLQQFFTDADLARVERLRASGVAVVWETDDDISAIPRSSPAYVNHGGRRGPGGRRGLKRSYEKTIAMARAASLMTTPSPHLAQRYTDAGVVHVQTIENRLSKRDLGLRARRSQGLVIGTVLAAEHLPDLQALRLDRVLGDVLAEHDGVRVIAIGLDLGLHGHRYTHRPGVPYRNLLATLSEFDIGLAPLADSAFSRARSDVKVREYASAGAMWLASPVGPYVGLGELQGGRLVPAEAWGPAIVRAITQHEERACLRANARAWAEQETIERHGTAWETAFRAAVQRTRVTAADAERRTLRT